MDLRMLHASAVLGAVVVVGGAAAAVPANDGPDSRTRAVAEYWTAERVAEAVPRTPTVDAHGRGFMPEASGELQPYGHDAGAAAATPLRVVSDGRPPAPGQGGPPPAKGGPPTDDTTPPAVSDLDPQDTTIGAAHTFAATVTDASRIRSVEFVVAFPADSPPQTFRAEPDAVDDRWRVTLDGFTGSGTAGQWWVVARDGAPRGGNTQTTDPLEFTVDTDEGEADPDGSDDVAHAPWPTGGAIQTAAGRLLFRMPDPDDPARWQGYRCSGTVVTDETAGRSVVLTAAHCVYDDVAKVFARDVLFVPHQQATTGDGSDRVCSNDPLGCWAPSFGVVDDDWASRTFPSNIPWDHGWYVVPDTGAHSPGMHEVDPALDVAVDGLPLTVTPPAIETFTHALGYSGTHDPELMFCAEALGTESNHDGLWLDTCALAGGASGGPWVQPMDLATGSGPIISVSSWGWTGSAGMGGPDLSAPSVACVFAAATDGQPDQVGGLVAPGC